MRSVPFGILCSAAALLSAAPAFAASDYLLVIDGVEGESSVAIEVLSWSWGASNPNIGSSGQDGRITATQNSQSLRESPSRPSVQASQNTQSLRESPTRASTGGTAVADLDGDGRPDLDSLAKVNEVSGFTIVLAPGSPSARSSCAAGKHFKEVHLVARYMVYDLEDVVVTSCGTGGGGGGGMAMTVTGKTKEFKGHVTLLK